MINERSSSSILRKTISEPEKNPRRLGFDPRLGLRNRFLRIELDERSSIIQVFLADGPDLIALSLRGIYPALNIDQRSQADYRG